MFHQVLGPSPVSRMLQEIHVDALREKCIIKQKNKDALLFESLVSLPSGLVHYSISGQSSCFVLQFVQLLA